MPVTDYGDEGSVSFELKEALDALVKAEVISDNLHVNVGVIRIRTCNYLTKHD